MVLYGNVVIICSLHNFIDALRTEHNSDRRFHRNESEEWHSKLGGQQGYKIIPQLRRVGGDAVGRWVVAVEDEKAF